jgi:protein-L-isoaspartate(D-aspartate) O-methyltransferase
MDTARSKRHGAGAAALLPALLLLLAAGLPGTALGDEAFTIQRERMVSRDIAQRGIRDPAVLAAMRNVPRHEFVPEARQRQAYADNPLPIGFGQTISQPYIVAYMTELLRLEPGMRTLEIGTGSGYQAAVLAEILDEVYSIEIIPELARWGEANLRRTGYDAVQVRQADGYHGWDEHGPYDAIMVTAAADHIPPPLIAQLEDGGRMVIPVGSPFRTQVLMLVTRHGEEVRTQSLLPVRFVPLTRAGE